jgi:hypothetical protein
MPSNHDAVIRMFHCLFIVLKIPLFSSHDSVIGCSIVFSFHFLSFILKTYLRSYLEMF